jgi:hypothetical protein
MTTWKSILLLVTYKMLLYTHVVFIFQRPGPLSADSLIEDLLQQKETFTVRPQQAIPTPEIKASSAQVSNILC